ncbi:RluA family pseudouridine synthase [Ligilactobacillus equi]|uniref:RluA family pseudouridine synthase n=1 Tax=Ligilactobacillus equi TaxID=137357 RepID=UPI002ED07671
MEINWTYNGPGPTKVRTFLKDKGLSRRFLAQIRNNNGGYTVNGREGRMVDMLSSGDQITVTLPTETARKIDLVKSFVPIKVVYEDRDFLILDKPDHLASIPSHLHRLDSVVNRVAGYYQVRSYHGLVPHIATRLDRDTTGLVLLAKHRYAHSLVDQQLRNHAIEKEYVAITSGQLAQDYYDIRAPIGRKEDSIMLREVRPDGQAARTELFVTQQLHQASLLRVRLHTGRTHQIRVHTAFLGHPLVGDRFYAGMRTPLIQRQALHCQRLKFYQPLLEKWVEVTTDLPADMQAIIAAGGIN